jgi:aminoglycoside phosphotransferase family enzyme/predicted kinase
MTEHTTDGALLAELARPSSYPEPPARVELRTTHISWVFLTEHEVWKVKRPVNLGFLDFSTAERRRHFCEEEVRLNQRLAPNVYLGVVPVRRGSAGHTFVGNAPIVDHAVKMRRLPDDESAAALVRAGRLEHSHLEHLARRLARFYAEARATPAFGAIATIRGNVEDNLTLLDRFVSPHGQLDGAALADVAAAQRRDLLRHAAALEARQTHGHIRDGHGDLRLEHVYFPHDAEPLVIDALEFDERFRCADVALDVAFLAMELEASGRGDLADHFLYRMARATNDYDFYPLLDFYLVYRALVRCKVAALVAADPATPADKARRKWDEAARLLALAHRHSTGPARTQPCVMAVGGLVGSGKSFLAETIARDRGAVVVASDPTRKHLGGCPPTERAPAALYSPEFSDRTYREVLRRAEVVAASGRSVILDGTFPTARRREQARALATRLGVPFVFIEARCDEQTLRQRLRARAAAPSESDADEAVLERLRRGYQSPHELPAEQRLVANTDRDLGEALQALNARLQAP